MTRKAPLSFAQQRLWFLAQLEPRSPAYNILSATQIEGPLDTAALERSLTEMSRRHETLRTTFVVEDATPVQIIHPPSELKLQQFDFTTVSEEQREKEARRLMREEAVCPFDLVTGPLLRAKLLRMEPEKHLLLLTIHHIVSDGWSMGVLHQELFTLYEAFILGHSSPLSELQQLRAEGEEVPLLFMLDPSEERLEPPGKVKETGLFRLLWSRVQRHLRKLALLGSGAYFNAASGVPLVNFRT